MKTLKKVFAAISSLVLALALMVPTIAWADDDDMTIRVHYEGTPIPIAHLTSVPHTVSITFHANVDYPGYAGVAKTINFSLSNSPEMQALRVAQSVRNSDGSFTVILSNGDHTLPMKSGVYFDLGTLSIQVDGTLDFNSPEAAAMRQASIVVTDLDISDADYMTTMSIGAGTSEPSQTTNFSLRAASFTNVQGLDPDANKGNENNNAGARPNDTIPNYYAPQIYGTDGISGPQPNNVLAAANPVMTPLLNDLWNGVDNSEYYGALSNADLARVRSFLEAAKANGWNLTDVAVRYDVLLNTYDGASSVPADDIAKLNAKFASSTYTSLGYYNVSINVALSVPDGNPPQEVVSLKYTDVPLSFTVKVPSGSITGKAAVMGYVHDGDVKSITEGVETNDVDAITFPASEFSTYCAYATSKSGHNLFLGSTLAQTGDLEKPMILLFFGLAVLFGALAVVVFARKRKQNQS